VQITVAATTLLGLDDQPAELEGYGPIPASMAIRISEDPTGTWHRLITDRAGRLLDHQTRTYKPPGRARQKRHRPRPTLRPPRLPTQSLQLRTRSPDPVPGRRNQRRQPATTVQTTSHAQAPQRPDRHQTQRRK
jgi:hypothetical protein